MPDLWIDILSDDCLLDIVSYSQHNVVRSAILSSIRAYVIDLIQKVYHKTRALSEKDERMRSTISDMIYVLKYHYPMPMYEIQDGISFIYHEQYHYLEVLTESTIYRESLRSDPRQVLVEEEWKGLSEGFTRRIKEESEEELISHLDRKEENEWNYEETDTDTDTDTEEEQTEEDDDQEENYSESNYRVEYSQNKHRQQINKRQETKEKIYQKIIKGLEEIETNTINARKIQQEEENDEKKQEYKLWNPFKSTTRSSSTTSDEYNYTLSNTTTEYKGTSRWKSLYIDGELFYIKHSDNRRSPNLKDHSRILSTSFFCALVSEVCSASDNLMTMPCWCLFHYAVEYLTMKELSGGTLGVALDGYSYMYTCCQCLTQQVEMVKTENDNLKLEVSALVDEVKQLKRQNTIMKNRLKQNSIIGGGGIPNITPTKRKYEEDADTEEHQSMMGTFAATIKSAVTSLANKNSRRIAPS